MENVLLIDTIKSFLQAIGSMSESQSRLTAANDPALDSVTSDGDQSTTQITLTLEKASLSELELMTKSFLLLSVQPYRRRFKCEGRILSWSRLIEDWLRHLVTRCDEASKSAILLRLPQSQARQ